MTEAEIKAYRKMPPTARYMTMVLTAMHPNLPDGWINVSPTKLASAVNVNRLTVRQHLTRVQQSGLFELRQVIRDNRPKIDVRPTFLGPFKLSDALPLA